jgi:uncharacterized protein YlxW (UPF0749 family)
MKRLLLPTLAALSLVASGHAVGAPQPQLEERIRKAELLAGLTPVEGPGLRVALRHSPRAVPGVDRENLLLHDQDVNAVLNALRVAGAEALSISGSVSGKESAFAERVLVNTAAVDSRGGVVVNSVLLLPPYHIQAIGDPAALRYELFREEGVVKKAGLDTLEMIEVRDASRLEIPAARVQSDFKFARSKGEPVVAAPRPAAPSEGDRRPVTAPAPAPASIFAKPAPGASVPVAIVPRRPASKRSSRQSSDSRPSASQPPVSRQAVNEPAPPLPVPPPATVAKAVSPAPTVAPAASTGSDLFGGKGLAKYHAAGCRFGERIEPSQRVVFHSAAEAEKSGRSPCPFCVSGASKTAKR